MKRFITILTIGALFACFGMLMYALVPSVPKIPYAGKLLRKLKLATGAGTLFDRPGTMVNYESYLRVHEDGKWQPWQQMIKPLHEEYLNTGNFSALKLSRLDLYMFKKVRKIAKDKNIGAMKKSKAYSNFLRHMRLRYWQDSNPDSLEVAHYKISRTARRPTLLLTFKAAVHE